MLFYNITCSETLSMLFQCVDLHNIAVYDCDGNFTTGVVCLNTNSLTWSSNNMTAKLTTELYNLDSTSTHGSNIHILLAILGSVGTAAVATGIVIITVIKMKMRR